MCTYKSLSGRAFKGDEEAIEALKTLGYSLAEAREALKEVPDTVEKGSERLRAALKTLGTSR